MFKITISSLLIALFLVGCSHTYENGEYSQKKYQDVSRDAFLNAAKRVIKLSDEEFTISSYRDSITAIRAIPKNKGFTVDININQLELNTTIEENNLTAKLKITTREDIFSQNTTILKNEIHKLFWDRVDFLLGLKNEWYSCTKYRLFLNFDGFFCNIKYNADRYPTKGDIIGDISIQKPAIIEEKSISLATIDLSILETIELPFVNKPKQEEISLAIVDLAPMGDINQTTSIDSIVPLNETNTTTPIEEKSVDLNISNENNNTLLVAIKEDIQKDFKDFNETNTTNEIVLVKIPQEEKLVIIDTNTTFQEAIIKDQNISIINPIENQNDLNISQNIIVVEEELPKDSPSKNQSEILETTPIQSKRLTPFGEKFMAADPKTDYTINLALAFNKEKSDAFILKHNLKGNSFALGFVDENGKYYIKIMYGVFKSRNEALEVIKKFPKELKASRPTVEGVHRKQILFLKKGEDLSVE